jgi:hypothetical protein
MANSPGHPKDVIPDFDPGSVSGSVSGPPKIINPAFHWVIGGVVWAGKR